MSFSPRALTTWIGVLIFTIIINYYYNYNINKIDIINSNDQHRSASAETRAKYSGVSSSNGELFSIDRHFIRRRRSRRSVPDSFDSSGQTVPGVRGVARDCGKSCHIRLRSNNVSYMVHLHRFHQISTHKLNRTSPHIRTIIPIVQIFESETSVVSSQSRSSPYCIYKARVVGSHEHSILNLCDSHQGLFGLLALPTGVFQVEPIIDENGENNDESSRHRSHLVHPFEPHHFRAFDGPTENTVTALPENLTSYDETGWEDVNRRKTRERRAANSWDHYVEVMVVADSKMYEYHGYNLEDYVLTLFSTVASIYRHQSLRASINVVVVKLVILKNEYSGPQITANAQQTLQGFCRWQHLYNDKDDDSINHHDVAILLTRADICRAPGKCDTLGLAELGTMCDMQKSCAIIEDNGLSAAFTIAHELGHVFNIPHDDERKCSQFMHVTKNNYHIMAPTLEYNTHPWSWSACSSGMLEKFLDNHRGQIQCLFDQPVQRKFYEQLFESDSPGRKYDVNQQCGFVFGPQSELCPYMPTCRRLWCATYYGSQMGCRTQHMPWADGTPCDHNDSPKYCHRGECVLMSEELRSRVDGGWGQWQPWGQCSRTCGGGIQKGMRDCDSPRPLNGGKYCVGQREQYRSCNTEECPWDTPGFREVQCGEYNNKDVGIHGVSTNAIWIPKYVGVASNERCKLYCRISGTAASYLLKDKVIDGSTCDRNGDDICIDGTCMKAGCDHVLQSTQKRDRCGVCGGDNSTCKTVKGTYNERGSFGYNEVMKIPAGSANIDIRQHGYNNQKDDDNYLSLRASNNEFLLNGYFQVSVFRQQIAISDVILEYSGSDNVIERINGTGPIRNDIYLHVLSVGSLHPPDISYEYMTRVETQVRPPVRGFFWKMGERWSNCDKTCQGSQSQEVICVDAMNQHRQTNERFCQTQKPKQNTRMCNIDCSTRWQVEETSACTAQCGTGEKKQRVSCIRVENQRSTVARDSDCEKESKPAERVACHVDCTGKRWSYSEWSQCSVTCGRGESSRNATCLDSAGRLLDQKHCGEQREQLRRQCNMHPCPKWKYGHWSECSRSCDGGVRMRHSQCVDASEREIDPRHCGEKVDRESCNEQLCTAWSFGSWSECSVSCGEGIQTREATCTDTHQRNIEDSKCNYRERIVRKSCSRPSCPSWKVGEWTPCSVSCEDGWSSRRVSCVDSNGKDVSSDECSKLAERPPSHRQCNQGPCPFWRTNQWSQCSVTCGSGVRERSIECVYREQIVDNSFCGDSAPPQTTQPCNLITCTSWEITPWTSCSVTCGTGSQTRKVFCVSGHDKKLAADSQCDRTSKPRQEKTCERDACETRRAQAAPLAELPPIRWASGPWTECSVSCGKGIQKRLVKCRDHVRDLDDKYCQHLEKIEDVQSCQIRSCAFWRTAPWMPCPASCGVHVHQSRSVLCVSRDSGDTVDENDCEVEQRPSNLKSCKLEACPKGEPPLGKWVTDEWAQCTVSCGGGWRRRHVSCSSNVCDEEKKPKSMDICNTHTCPPKTNNTWQISPWTHCSVTCGSGVQRRRVWCEDASSLKIADDTGCFEDKPTELRDCELPLCITNASSTNSENPNVRIQPQWQASPWSACSVKCGRGVRRRTVSCIDSLTNSTLASGKCNGTSKPAQEHKCRVMHCPRWRGSPWGACSATCGAGIRQREVFCQRGRRQRTNETECAAAARPPATARCYIAPCPAYHWTSTPWSKCVNGCIKEEQYRRVYCMSNTGKRAAPRMCSHQSAPATQRQCDISKCPYEWVPRAWQTCSRTCGKGIQLRIIECRVKQNNQTVAMMEHSVPKEKCDSLPLPSDQQECALNPCEAEYNWQIGPWETCSKSCGQGVRRRKVRCFHQSGNRMPRQNCEKITQRPRRTQSCFIRNCLPSTCQEIRSQDTSSLDGDYKVLLDGFPIDVYCHRMNETIPGTYITLDPQNNYAEVYGKRLIYPHTCPFNGDRNDSCACTEHGDASAGFTRFNKIRVDLLNRKININDFTFATTESGRAVPYGTAGDCYSMKDCPQGRFMVDLYGTGLRVVDDLQWEDKGHRTTSRIDRTLNNARIEGRCGGYCGKCAPDKYKGLVFQVDHKKF